MKYALNKIKFDVMIQNDVIHMLLNDKYAQLLYSDLSKLFLPQIL